MTSRPREEPATLDFETEPIRPRPSYPPKPVGFSLMLPGEEKSTYYAWGHPTKNNCTFAKAQQVLKKLWKSKTPILFHNAKFDVDVAETHMGVGPLPWHKIQDSMFLMFLADPHSLTLALKPAADKWLNMPPTEQDAVKDWLFANQQSLRDQGLLPADVELSNAIGRAESESGEPRNWGAWICLAPGDLVGEYADGDVIRTRRLYDMMGDHCEAEGMMEAYDRECALVPLLLANEREGVRVDLDALRNDAQRYQDAMATVDNYIRQRLGVPDLNIDSTDKLADALNDSGVVTNWSVTKTGKRSTAKDKMTPDMFNDKNVSMALGYRSRLSTCLGTFILPWLKIAEESGGRIYTNWSQVRQPKGGKDAKGTRTGRMSSSPNFQNIPKNLEEKDDDYEHPSFLEVPELPLMRRYVLPDDDNSVLLHRDYNQQELRVLAHFEDGRLLERYKADPTMDIHQFVTDEIQRITGVLYLRAQVKQVNFGIIYGMGYGALAKKINDTVETARAIKVAQRKALPGANELERSVKKRGAAGENIITWGKRHYYAEEPKMVKGELKTFEYKLLNYLIQGSAADITKEALLAYDKIKKHGRLLITVHDEINISCPAQYADEELALLRQAMESIPLDVPLLSDGKMGPNWGEMSKYKEPAWADLHKQEQA